MAEIVEVKTEETIPELEEMLNLLFERDQVQTIHTVRRDNLVRINRPSGKRKEDFWNLIEFEMKLLRMIRLRCLKKGISKKGKLTSLETTMGQKIINLSLRAIRLFPGDLRQWIMFLQFCKQMRYFSQGSRFLEQMVQMHGSQSPDVYKLAAQWELKDCNSVEKARQHIMNGIHIHKDCKALFAEAFKLELFEADKKVRKAQENMPMTTEEKSKFANRAATVYVLSIKKLDDVELMNDLVNMCQPYDFAKKLQKRILNDMMSLNRDERLWDIIARRELHIDHQQPREPISRCAAIYQRGVEYVPTEKMWSMYLDCFLELAKDTNVMPIFKKKLLLSIFKKASEAGMLNEKYYLAWVQHLQGTEKQKKLVDVLDGAVKKLPDSVTLWHTLLRVHLTRGEDEQVHTMFDRAVNALNVKSLPLWKLMIQFEQTKRNNKVEDIFKKSWHQPLEISGPLKSMYLEWLVLTSGIQAARKVYDAICTMPPHSLEMHKKMISLETIQANVNYRRIRRCHTAACAQFGKDNVDVWMDHIKFETNIGEPDKVSMIYWTARKELSPPHMQTFLSEYSLICTLPEEEMEQDQPTLALHNLINNC